MDVRAQRALSDKISNFVYSCHLDSNFYFDADDWTRIVDIGKSVIKYKGKWLDENAVHGMFYGVVRELLSGFEVPEGKLTNFISAQTVIDALEAEIFGIPYRYDVYFELSDLGFSKTIKTEVEGRAGFCELDSHFVKGVTSTLLGGESANIRSYYFRASVEGYIGIGGANETVHNAQGLMKVFLDRSLSSGLFFSRVVGPELPILYSIFAHKVGPDNSLKQRLSLTIPRDMEDFIRGVRVSPTCDGISQADFDLKMADFSKLILAGGDLAARVFMASEWRFDSISEVAPAMSVVKVCIGLEAIFGDPNSEEGMTRTLSDRCAYSLAVGGGERVEITDLCRNLYRLRETLNN